MEGTFGHVAANQSSEFVLHCGSVGGREPPFVAEGGSGHKEPPWPAVALVVGIQLS